jgi:anti-anti-sigma factor
MSRSYGSIVLACRAVAPLQTLVARVRSGRPREPAVDSASIPDDRGAIPPFGQAVTHLASESVVRVWGGCDGERAWLLRQGLHDLVFAKQRRITIDVSELRFADFTAVAILVGALVRIRQIGADVAVCPPSSGAYRVLKRADLATTRVVGVR